MNISLDCFNRDNGNLTISRNEVCSTLCENKHTINMILFLYIPLCINIISTILSVIFIKAVFNYYKNTNKSKRENKSSQCNEINISQIVLHPFDNHLSLAIPE
jgi:hypothetical protein